MIENDYVQRMLAYDHWANLRILASLSGLPQLTHESPPSKLFSHIIAAEEVWLARVLGRPYQGMSFWPTLDPTSWSERLDNIHEQWKTFVDASSTNLDASYSYHNSKGQPYETSLKDILTHLTIHGQHHRAQIAVHLRALGQVPPATDFIYFTRADEASSGDRPV
ncbi:MAG TPA: DinB family protein [Rhodothermales bacterium]|nr:DinB family protein [Rhodothermales bacterium]